MNKYISKLHYLTQDLPHRSHAEQALTACEAGANWIQYRCLTKDDDALLADIHQLAAICDDWGATLLVTNHYHLVPLADLQGVHLEDLDADIAAVRAHIGADKTIGASATSMADIVRQYASGEVDYFGCGPFAYTATKPNDYPLFGVQGYEQLTAQLAERQIPVPVLAVGGVTAADIASLLAAGVYGIALSGAVNAAPEPGQAFREIYREVY